MLASSEHDLPARLRALGYNTGHISGTVFAHEVPPAAMKQLLTGTWGCGEHLATALLSLYGGHVLYASAAVRELATAASPAAVEGCAALGSIIHVPSECLSVEALAAAGVAEGKRAELRQRVLVLMRALVADGFVPLDDDEDKAVQVISLANAGWVVPRYATAGGVPPEAWDARTSSGKQPTCVLVPSSYIVRLLMAEKVSRPPGTGAVGAAAV